MMKRTVLTLTAAMVLAAGASAASASTIIYDLTFSSDPTALGVLTVTTPTALAYGGAPLPLVSSIFQSFSVTFAGPTTFSGNIFSQLTFDAAHNLIGLDASSTAGGETLLIGHESFSGRFGLVLNTLAPGSSYELFNTSAGSGAINSLTITQVVASAPEPAAWALMIVGFGLTGAALRRRGAERVRA